MSVSMKIGSFQTNDTKTKSITNSLIAELVYKKISVEQCQHEIQDTYEVKTLDYEIQPSSQGKQEMILAKGLNVFSRKDPPFCSM